MDPVSRRFVWRHIDAIKRGRVVLLTTHAMEEADLLADAVAIMRNGELAAFGSPLELKAELGSALQFSILVDKSEVKRAETNIRAQYFAYDQQFVSIEAGEAGNITVTIQKIRQGSSEHQDGVDPAVLSKFVAWLEDTDVSGVFEYGFSNSSLEEVFLKVTEGEGSAEVGVLDDDEDLRNRVCCRCWCMGCIRCCLKSLCRCCCCLRAPAVTEEDLRFEQEQGGEEATSTLNGAARRLASYQPALSILRQTETLLRNSFARSWSGKSSIANYIMFGLMVVIVSVIGCVVGDLFFVPFMTLPTVFLSLMLVSLDVPIYNDRELGLFHLMRTQGLLKGSYLAGTGLYGLLVQLAFGCIMLSLFYAAPCFRDGLICFPEIGEDYANCGWATFFEPMILAPTNVGTYDVQGESVDLYAVRSPGSYGMLIGTALYFSLAIPGAILSSTYLPGNKIAMAIVAFICLCVGVAPVILYVTLIFGLEEVEKCYQDICPLESLVGDTGKQFLNCVGSLVNTYRISSLCMPPRAAILPQFGVFQTLAMTTMSQIKFATQPSGYEDMVLSQQGVTSGCYGGVCKFPYAHVLYWKNLAYMLSGAVLLLVLGISLATIVDFPPGWVLDLKHRISHTCLRLHGRICCRGGRVVRLQGRDGSMTNMTVELEEVTQERNVVCEMVAPFVEESEPEEIESAFELHEVVIKRESIPRTDLPPVLMRKLRKVYPSVGGLPSKVALKSLDLHVPAGQVLGLLGKNGAGKTTALKILSGSHDASGGLGMVSGYDVMTERINVFERLGNCPQFDVIWPGRTVENHLLFFARLKGLPRSKVYDAAQSIATAVGLGAPAVYHRNAGDLSGGMRRRLSIAISLIGAPKVLLLDEPTTGLDPSTRNNIWSLINSFATEDRAMIITTHMMIEADTLCNRIAIVSHGELQVVATQQHLKNKFGSGYLLQLNLIKSSASEEECAMRFVRTHLHPEAQKQNKQAKTLRVSLPRDLNLQRVFEALYSDARVTDGRINQFLLSQSSLEDVFLTLGE
jgi:ABC-type multidrug transport system ATPase subunit